MPWYTDTGRIASKLLDKAAGGVATAVVGGTGKYLYGKVAGKRKGGKTIRSYGVSGRSYHSVRGRGRGGRKRMRRGKVRKNGALTRTVVHNMIEAAMARGKSTSTLRKKWEMNVLSDQNQTGLDCYIQSCLWYGGDRSDSLPPVIRIFSPFKIPELLDAVSVLYNGKTKEDDWTKTPGNYIRKGFKCEFSYVSSKITLKNLTNVDYKLHVYEFTAKKHTIQDISSVLNSHKATTKYATNPTVTYDNDLGYLRITEGVEMADFNQADYSLKSYVKDFKVGTSVSLSDVEKRLKIDFTKMVTETAQEAIYMKGSKQYVFRLDPYLGWSSVGDRDEGNAVRHYPYAYSKDYGIACTWDKVFKVMQPDKCAEGYEGELLAIQNITTRPNGETAPVVAHAAEAERANVRFASPALA